MKTQNYYSRTEINQRESNEDCFRVFSVGSLGELPITILVVADGMGGHEHGDDVSLQAVLKVEDFLQKAVSNSQKEHILTPENLKQTLLNAIESASSLVRRMIQVNGWKKAGSTIVVAAIWQDKVVAANLGDSHLFHYIASRKEVMRVTQDHSVAGILAQAKLITEEMTRYHERRGQLEFFVGAETMPSPDPVYERTVESGDLLLLCSDGISGLLSLEQIETILAQPETNLEKKASQLIQAARDAGETDNQTLILWDHKTASNTRLPSQLEKDSSLPDTEETPQEPESNIPAIAVSDSELRTKPHSPLTRTNRILLLGGAMIVITLAALSLWRLSQLRSFTTDSFAPQCPNQRQSSTQTDRFGLAIECFLNNGLVLITQNSDGSRIAWNVQEVIKMKSPKECHEYLAVPREHQDKQSIDIVLSDEQGIPQKLFTRSQLGCRRLWVRQNSLKK